MSGDLRPAVLLAGSALLTASLALPAGPLRTLLALPLALLLPGSALVLLALPRPRIGGTPFLAASLVASSAFYAFSALVLYGLSLRLDPLPIVVCVDLVVLAACLRLGLPGGAAPRLRPALSLALLLAALSALAAVAGGVAAAQRLLAPPTSAGFSSLAFAGSWSDLRAVPTLPAAGRLSFRVRVKNGTPASERYLLVAKLDGRRFGLRPLALAAGGSGEAAFGGRLPQACPARLSVELRNGSRPAAAAIAKLTLPLRCAAATGTAG